MTAKEHLDAVKEMMPSMPLEELSVLMADIAALDSNAKWYLQNKTHSKIHHLSSAEGEKD